MHIPRESFNDQKYLYLDISEQQDFHYKLPDSVPTVRRYLLRSMAVKLQSRYHI